MRIRMALVALAAASALGGCDCGGGPRLPETVEGLLPESWRPREPAPWEPGFEHEPAPPDEPITGGGNGFDWYRRSGSRNWEATDDVARFATGELISVGRGFSRHDADGTELRGVDWSWVELASVVALAGGDAVVLGVFGSWDDAAIDLDPGPAELMRTPAGGRDLFVARLGPTDDTRFAITLTGTTTIDDATLALGLDGDLVVAGRYAGNLRFDTGGGTARTALPRPRDGDAFVAQLSSDGTLEWVARIGGAGEQQVASVGVAPDGDVIVGGQLWSSRYDAPTSLHCEPGVPNEPVERGSGYVYRIDAAGRDAMVVSFPSGVTAVGAWGDDTLVAVDRGPRLRRVDARGSPVPLPFAIDDALWVTSIEVRDDRIVLAGSYHERADLDPGDGEHWAPTRPAHSGVFVMELGFDGTLQRARAALPPGVRTRIDPPHVIDDDAFVTGESRNACPGEHGWEWCTSAFLGRLSPP